MKIAFAFCLFFLVTAKSFAQADIPVDYQRGAAMVAVPIAEIKDRGISVPISLSYNSNGVKVGSSEAGNDLVGINWSLLAGGKITRKVNGLPDDFVSITKSGWLARQTSKIVGDYVFTADNSVTSCDEQQDWNNLNSSDGFLLKDTEPDEFKIMLPGISGNFVFDNNGIVRTFPFQDIKIKPFIGGGGAVYAFEITSPEGVKYVFDKIVKAVVRTDLLQENTSDEDITVFRREYNLYKYDGNGGYFASERVDYVASWMLTKIISPLGGVINIEYYDGAPLLSDSGNYDIANPDVSPVSLMNTQLTDKKYYIRLSKEQELRVKSVSSSTGNRADFFLYKNKTLGDDLNRLEEAYTSISIADSVASLQPNIKNFELSYYVVKDPENKTRRVFLKSVQEATTCYKFPPFKFSYYGVDSLVTNLSAATSGAQDFFGYFNGSGAEELKPPFVYFSEYGQGEPFQFSLYSGSNPAIGRIPINSNIVNSREISPLLIGSGSLSKITYPPGGFVTFEYEPNQYYQVSYASGFLSQNSYADGIRIKKIVSHDAIDENNNIVKELEYKKEDGNSSGVINYPYQFAIDANYAMGSQDFLISKYNLTPEVELKYQRVTLKIAGKKSSVFEYSMPPMYPALASDGWNATVIKPVRFADDGICPQRTFRLPYGYPFVKNTNLDFDEGLLAYKYDFNGDGNLIRKTTYDYQRITPGAVLVKAFKFDNIYSDYWVGEYNILTNVKRVLKKETTTDYDPLSPHLTFEKSVTNFYDSPNHQYLSKTLTENSNGEIYERTFSYAKDFNVDVAHADEISIALKDMNDTHIFTPIVEDISYTSKNGIKKVIGAILTKYKTIGQFYGLKSETLTLPKIIGGFSPADLVSNAGAKEFRYDQNYITLNKFERYDNKANLIDLSDGKQNRKSYLFGYNKKYLVAEIVNAKAEEVALSDFETNNSQSFEGDDLENFSTTDIYSGNNTLFLGYNYSLWKTIKKSKGRYYRLSWVGKTAEYNEGRIIVELTDGLHTISTIIDTYPEGPNWRLYEKLIDVSTLNAQFTIKITPHDDVKIDNLVFSPALASINMYTYQFPYGKSSESDLSGKIIYYEYDDLGRIKFIKDRDKNILKYMEYKFNNDFPVGFSADFKERLNFNTEGYTKLEPGKVNVGDTYVFNQKNSCIAEVTHAWYVNNVLLSNYEGFSYSFNLVGNYTIKHIVSHPIFGIRSTEITKQVVTIPLALALTVNGPHELTWCDYMSGTIDKTFTANVKSGSSNGNIKYDWSYSRLNETVVPIQKIAGGGPNDNYITIRYPYGYYVYCKISDSNQETSAEAIRIDYFSRDCITEQ